MSVRAIRVLLILCGVALGKKNADDSSKLPFPENYPRPRSKVQTFKPNKLILEKMKAKLDEHRSRRNQESCSLCAPNSSLQDEFLPTYDLPDTPEGLSCGGWDSISAGFVSESEECDRLVQVLRPQCCNSTTDDVVTGGTTTVQPTTAPPAPTNAPASATAPSPFEQQEEICTICGGAELQRDVLPIYPPIENIPDGLSCGDWNDFYAAQATGEECLGIKGFFSQCCISPVPGYICEQNIRNQILEGSDTATAPIVSYQDGLNVTVDLIFWHVTDIDELSSTAEVFIWLNLLWNDPRLRWAPDINKCNNAVTLRASFDVEKSEIWVPDFDLFNQADGLQKLGDFKADVYSDGTVLWRRNGPVRALCSFVGLAKIPFDTLGCQFSFGFWERQVATNEPFHFTLGNENGTGLIFGNFNPSYNQYRIVKEKSFAAVDAREVIYTFYFKRAQNYYVFNIIIPTIVLTFISFGVFLLDIRVGERMSYGMALALVIVAQQIITGDLLPVSNERLWIDKFVGWSFYFVVFGLAESVLVGYLHFVREDHMEVAKKHKKDDEFVSMDAVYDMDAGYDMRGVNNLDGRYSAGELPARRTAHPIEDEESIRSRQSQEQLRKRYTTRVSKAVLSPKNASFNEDLSDVESLQHMLATMDVTDLPEPPESMEEPVVENIRHVSPPRRKSPKKNSTPKRSNKRATKKRPPAKKSFRKDETRGCNERVHHLIFQRWTLRDIDFFCFFLSCGAYIVFLIIMFARVPRWGADSDFDDPSSGA